MSLKSAPNLTSALLASRTPNKLHFSLSNRSRAPHLHPSRRSITPFQPSRRQISTATKMKDLIKPPGAEQEEQDDLLSSLTKRRGGRTRKGTQKISPKEWLLSEDGLKFRDPATGRTNWLGGEIPFPTNPWFKPQPPLSDGIRSKVYDSFKRRLALFHQHHEYPALSLAEKKKHDQLLLRQTSDQWGISRDRVAAIVRLKAMEESWSIGAPESTNEAEKVGKDPRKTLQLNFEKGMENVLGVERDAVCLVNEDVDELVNRQRQRKSRFFGTEFVPLDAPVIEQPSVSSEKSTDQDTKSDKPTDRKKRYEETDEPTEKRHIIGPDGLPRPPNCYISKPPSKVPMVFTDVSEFPRAPKPMSKRKAKYYPKTSLLPDYSATMARSNSPTTHARRSSSTFAARAIRHLEETQIPAGAGQSAAEVRKQKMQEEKRELAAELLRQFKGCSSSDQGLKMLEEFRTANSGGQMGGAGIDEAEIRETVLLQAGGMSFRKTNTSLETDLSGAGETKAPSGGAQTEEEKQIRSIKYEMMKTIYMRKLELNSAGRLLLPKAVRKREEQDQLILGTHAQAGKTSSESGAGETKQMAGRGLAASVGTHSNSLIKRCMKGPLGRLKQRQLASQKK